MNQHKPANEREMEMLAYWDKNNIFERSVEERPEDDSYVFYDGPPFATGLPHYGHLVASVMKDTVPRYWTMKGKRVERVWGWDCHGLPIENIVEKDLNLKTKQDIEAMGIKEFNDACRATVGTFADEWKKIIHRFGRWIDMDNPYRTMDLNYMESVWWVFKQLHEKGMLYEGYRPMHICPRCATTLSASEVGQGYEDVREVSVTLRFKNKDEDDTYFLAWTTTPWTLPGNMLLAVGPSVEYVRVKQRSEQLILAKSRIETLDGEYEIVEEMKGADLVGAEYEPLMPYFKDREGAYKVVEADFVSTEDGTGIVHIAPAFGEDDFAIGQELKLDLIRHINIDGTLTNDVTDFAGMQAKEADPKIIELLAGRGQVYKTEQIMHSYPHCWRCDTALLNYATDSWFVSVEKLHDKLLETNKGTAWVPKSMKDGRFGKWLEGARDWSVSRKRYWGAPLPVWRSEDGDVIVFGSVAELEEASGQKITDIHKHIVDEIEFEKDGKTYKRVPEVLDCWFESGSMPYARLHYPFDNKEMVERGLPADFIAEGQDQTRGWFYVLHVLSTILFDKPAFEHVIVNGIVVAEDGKKMSKKLKNYPDPMEIIEKYGADALRFYLLASPVMHAENMKFSEKGVKEVSNKLIGTLKNVLAFYQLYVTEVPAEVEPEDLKPLDAWILSRLEKTRARVEKHMDSYELSPASRELQEFVTELSQWYVRRSRDRFKGDDAADAAIAARVLYRVLEMTARLAAPFTPFMAEYIWQGIETRDEADSVHLAPWPQAADIDFLNEDALTEMKSVRELVTKVLDARMDAGIPVRQVLGKVVVSSPKEIDASYLDVIREEVNVQEIEWKKGEVDVDLDTNITPELRQLGLVREIQRQGNALRRKAKKNIDDEVVLYWDTEDEDALQTFAKYADDIKSRIKATELKKGMDGASETSEIETEDGVIELGL